MGKNSDPDEIELLDSVQEAGAPSWFVDAIKHPTTSSRIPMTDGPSINCVFWNAGDIEKPTVLLVHGFGANARSWHAVAPFLTANFRVVAVDLMGMGDSDWRAEYSGLDGFAKDLAEVIAALSASPVAVVGHSYGGACCTRLLTYCPELISHLVLIDTTLIFRGRDEERESRKGERTSSSSYADRQTIISKYRLFPPQPCPAWTLEYLARWSVHRTADGWSWRGDPQMPTPEIVFSTTELLQQSPVPTFYIGGGRGRNGGPKRLPFVKDALPASGRVVVIADSYHHVMLDEPIALAETLLDLTGNS